MSTDLGACEWFVWDLKRSNLVNQNQLDDVILEYLNKNPFAEPPGLAEFLVSRQILSPFQAERVLQGKTQGLVLGPYVLHDAIGSGSMGQVYKAQSKSDNEWYAVKVLPRRSMWNVRLARRQVRAFGQFNHQAVVPFVDVGTAGGLHYLVWPLVEGESLEAKVQREGKLTATETASVGMQVAQGLAISHQNDLFHGLIKPSNIMIDRKGQVKILDFGIGSLLVENEGESIVDTMSTANTLTSGLDCCAPESIMEPTNRTPSGDQYSLGCCLYYCLTGRYPFSDGTAVEKMMAHQFKQPTSLKELRSDAPEGLVEVIDRLMSKSADARYRGIDEVAEALQPFAGKQNFSMGKDQRPGFNPATSNTDFKKNFSGSSGRLPTVPRTQGANSGLANSSATQSSGAQSPILESPDFGFSNSSHSAPVLPSTAPISRPSLPNRQSLQNNAGSSKSNSPSKDEFVIAPPPIPVSSADPALYQQGFGITASAGLEEAPKRTNLMPLLAFSMAMCVLMGAYIIYKEVFSK